MTVTPLILLKRPVKMGTPFLPQKKEIRYYKVHWYGAIPLLLQH